MANELPEWYIEELTERLRGVATTHRGPVPLAQYVEAAGGAFPTLVRDLLDLHNVPWEDTSPVEPPRDQQRIELHPLNFEWHFTPTTSEAMAGLIEGGFVALLGMPTVGRLLRRSEFILIDNNPTVPIRDQTYQYGQNFVLSDIASLDTSKLGYADTVAFDAPWYAGEVLLWLSKAWKLVKQGGRIVFPLFPELLRPDARSERRLILEECAKLGRVSIAHKALRYSTPAFEAKALHYALTPTLFEWRSADLVVVSDIPQVPRQYLPYAKPLEREPWTPYYLGSQVVKVRASVARSETGPAIQPIVDRRSWGYPSVSLREANRATVDLWTSRNRVARIANHARVGNVLRQLNDAFDKRETDVAAILEAKGDAEAWKALLEL